MKRPSLLSAPAVAETPLFAVAPYTTSKLVAFSWRRISTLTAPPPENSSACSRSVTTRDPGEPVVVMNQPSPTPSVLRSSQNPAIFATPSPDGRHGFEKAVLAPPNWTDPFDDTLTDEYAVPKNVTGNGSVTAVVQSSQWLPVSVTPGTLPGDPLTSRLRPSVHVVSSRLLRCPPVWSDEVRL